MTTEPLPEIRVRPEGAAADIVYRRATGPPTAEHIDYFLAS